MTPRHSLALFVQLTAANAAAVGVLIGGLGAAGRVLGLRLPFLGSLPAPLMLLVPLVLALFGAALGAGLYGTSSLACRFRVNLPKGLNRTPAQRMRPG